MSNYSLNFSKGSSTIIAQYYNFLRLGFSGYKAIMDIMSLNAKYLAYELKKTGKFEVINKNTTFPVVTVKLKDADFTVFQLSRKLRQKGWIIPAYTLPKNADDISVMRMVIKENFGKDMVDSLLEDIKESYNDLESKNEEIHKNENPSLLY
ncbi:MAG: pyridoxal-dependent decarboxylase [Methanobacterium sp.]